jgi:Fe-Mn family superoxide dismutase
MKKRDFIKTSGILTLGAITMPIVGCNDPAPKEETTPKIEEKTTFTPFELPALDYEFGALEPNIDLVTILQNIEDKDEHIGLRNNGGGYYNHKLFWEIMSPNAGGTPSGELATAIDSAFGSFENFSTQFKDAAKTQFGSGWAWLFKGKDGKLAVTGTPNQDNPLMSNISTVTGIPILGIDVWEHAYYLYYQNKRGEYINNFFNVINWETVGKKLLEAK